MIRNTLGAAFIAGSALAIYNTDTIKPIVDEAVATAAKSIEVPPEISQNKEALQIGGGLLGLMLGVSMIAGAARRRMKKNHTIHPDVDQELNRKLSVLSDLISEKTAEKTQSLTGRVHTELSNANTALGELIDQVTTFDERLAGELKIDLTSLNKALSEIGEVEGAGQRVLDILEKIENSAKAHIALNTSDGALERMTKAEEQYSNAKLVLSNTVKEAMDDGNARTSWYPEHFNDILGKAATLDMMVLNSNGDTVKTTEAAEKLSATVSAHSDSIITKIINKGNSPGYSRPHLVAVSAASTQLIFAANEYVSAQKILAVTQNNNVPPLTSVEKGADLFQAAEADDAFAQNEDGMIEVPGYGAIPADIPPANNFD